MEKVLSEIWEDGFYILVKFMRMYWNVCIFYLDRLVRERLNVFFRYF